MYISTILDILWTLPKRLRANAVVGFKARIQPIRKDSKLEPFIVSPGLITKLVVIQKDNIWFEVELEQSVILGGKEYRHLMIKPKKADDSINKKKPVICTIKAVDAISKKQYLVDFGTVIAIAP